MVDLHSHVLPGLDDGARDAEEALAICRAAAEEGTEILAATPHVRSDYPTTPEQMEAALRLLTELVAGIVRLVPGGELALEQLDQPAGVLRRFGLAGNSAYLLVETPYHGWPLDLGERLLRLQGAGITPVIAHPERNPEVQARPALLQPLVDAGCLVQVTAASVDGRLGPASRVSALALIDLRLAHMIASDAHAPDLRAAGLSAAVRALGEGELARWLTDGVPRAIVDGRLLPPRPDGRRAGVLGRLRR